MQGLRMLNRPHSQFPTNRETHCPRVGVTGAVRALDTLNRRGLFLPCSDYGRYADFFLPQVTCGESRRTQIEWGDIFLKESRPALTMVFAVSLLAAVWT